MKRINVRFLLALVGGMVALAVGTVFLNRFQVNRNAGGLVKLARQKVADGQPYDAMGLMARYLRMRPKDGEVHAELAELTLDRALAVDATRLDLERAYGTLEEAVRRNPENDILRGKLAEFQVRVGRFDDAREHLGILKMREPADPPADGETSHEDGSPATPSALAATTASGDGKSYPLSSQQIEVLLARSFAGTGEIQQAARIAADVVGFDLTRRTFDDERRGSGSTEAYILLASLLQERLSDTDAADVVLRDLIERRGDDAMAWLAMARWHRQRGDLPAATTDVEEALKIAPEDLTVIFGAFEVALQRQDLTLAEELAGRARDIAPGDERCYRGLASVALQRGDKERAEQILQEGVSLLPDKPSLQIMLADTLLQQSDLDGAERTIDRIKDAYGTSSPAVGLLEGRLLMARQQWPQARQRLEEVRPLAAGLAEITRQIDLYLAQCLERLGEHDAQLDINRRILVDDPQSLAARAGAAAALAAAGKIDEALREYEAVAGVLGPERLPTFPQVWYPLLQLRIATINKRPAAEQDWSPVDELIATLEAAPGISSTQLALVRADVLAQRGETDAAAALLEGLVERADEVAPWLALGTLRLRSEGPAAAREVVDRVPEQFAASPGLLLLEAQILGREPPEQTAAGIDDLERRMGLLPPGESTQVAAAIAALRMSSKDPAAAERMWRETVKRQPDDLRAWTALFELSANANNVEEARAAANEIVRIAGAKSARGLLAQAGVRILRLRQAQRDKERSGAKLEFDEDELRLLDEARAMLIDAETERPGWAPVQAALGEVDGLRGNLDSAIDRLKRAVKIGSSNPEVVRQLVALLYSANRLGEAREVLESLGSDRGGVAFDRISAEMQVRAGNLDEAVALAEKSVSVDTANPAELLWLGQMLEKSGQSARAGEVLARAVEAGSDQPEAWLALFSNQFAAGQRAAAERTLDRARAALPSPKRELVEARGLEVLGRLDEAETALGELAAAHPDDLDVMTTRADFLIRAERMTAAKVALQELIDGAKSRPAWESATAWARRKLAEVTAAGGSYQDLEQALTLLGANSRDVAQLPSDDLEVAFKLLAGRAEPASWLRAIEMLRAIERSQPLAPNQRLALADLLERSGRWSDARGEMMALVSTPDTPPPFIGMFVGKLLDHGETELARTWLRRLQAAAPEAPLTTAMEARLAALDGDRRRAAELARTLMPPADLPAQRLDQLVQTAKLYEDMGFAAAADELLRRYAEASPAGTVARAEFLGRQGRSSEALDVLDAQRDTLSLERLLATALTSVRDGGTQPSDVERLDAWFARGRRIDPGSIMIQVMEAELRDMQGRAADAQQIYGELLDRRDLDPFQTAMVANNLAFHLAKPETADKALELINSALATLGPHPDLLDTRGLVLLAKGQTTEAVSDFEQAVLRPSDVKFLHLAYARLKAGDTLAAREALESGRKRGLTSAKLSAGQRSMLSELESALGLPPEQAADERRAGSRG